MKLFLEDHKSNLNANLPEQRHHKNRLDKGPRKVNKELLNKVRSLL